MFIPFSINWIYHKCCNYISNTNFKQANYKKIRYNIQKLCSFLFFSLPIKNIIILKNYYIKNNTVICIKPLIGNKIIVFEKRKSTTNISIKQKDFNLFVELKKKRRKNGKPRKSSKSKSTISF